MWAWGNFNGLKILSGDRENFMFSQSYLDAGILSILILAGDRWLRAAGAV